MRTYLDLTKSGIVLFVVLSGLVGFAVSHAVHDPIVFWRVIVLALGLYLLSSGSMAINQAQEWKADSRMPRTSQRPIPQGKVSPLQAYALGAVFVVMGLFSLALVSIAAATVGLVSLVLYNGFYTCWWKPKLTFGAVPGAIPGALPIVIGFAANSPDLLSPECVYLFLVMFLWQMPHFWCLAIHFKDDYSKGEFPVLPTQVGTERTLYHIGMYLIAYLGVALVAPWFTRANILYVLLIVPLVLKVFYEFLLYFRSSGRERWLPFFLWTNISMLIFIAVPVIDKWIFYKLV